MIVMDRPRVWEAGKKASAHLLSDLPGIAGQRELYAFALDTGLKPAWLQERGTPREHFDVWGGNLEAARRRGAREISARQLAEILAAKRDAERRERERQGSLFQHQGAA